MKKQNKIYVAGHTGMVGSALVRKLKKTNYKNLIFRTHSELDLMDQKSVEYFFEIENPDYVFIAAAKVGGIYANNIYRGEFLYENIMIQNNIIHSAHKIGVKKLIFLGSACIYPKRSKQPIVEEYLLSGFLEPTNEPYSIAKITGIKLCESYYKQYNDNFISIMPNNLYGPNDNFNLKTSHVVPALIRKFHEGKEKNSQSVEIWGSGKPKREFLHVDDLADACIFIMKHLEANKLYESGISHINVGSGDEVSINELSKMIKKIVGFNGKIIYNSDYPDGMPRKLLDISRLTKMGWKPTIRLNDGLKDSYEWFQTKYY